MAEFESALWIEVNGEPLKRTEGSREFAAGFSMKSMSGGNGMHGLPVKVHVVNGEIPGTLMVQDGPGS